MADRKRPEKPPKSLPNIETSEGADEVMERAAKGDESVRGLVRKLFNRNEEGARLLERYGNAFEHASLSLTKSAAGNNIQFQEAYRLKINALSDELAGPNPTPLEKLLCERVALCWFDVNETERKFVHQNNISFKDAEYRESRRDRAHRRFLAACKTLATIRKLALPAIQVNLANQQVNVAGSS